MPPALMINAFLAFIYSTTEDTLLGSAAVFIALTITVARATPSILRAVPMIVWSALKLTQATASSSEYIIPKITATSTTDIITGNAEASGKLF